MSTGSPPKKIDRLRSLMRDGKWNEALALAARWPRLGEHERAIRLGHEATAHPGFYRQLGRDPEGMRQAGIDALRARYGAEPEQPAG